LHLNFAFSETLAGSGVGGFPAKKKNLVFLRVCGFLACVVRCIFVLRVNDLLLLPVERKPDMRADIVFIIRVGRRI
jgi:hypothetical protein